MATKSNYPSFLVKCKFLKLDKDRVQRKYYFCYHDQLAKFEVNALLEINGNELHED